MTSIYLFNPINRFYDPNDKFSVKIYFIGGFVKWQKVDRDVRKKDSVEKGCVR